MKTSTARPNILSKRAQNILERLGGVSKMLEFYSSGRSFMNLPHSGRKTEAELTAFCENLIGSTYSDSQESSLSTPGGYFVEDVGGAMNHYFSNKKLLSNATQKFLTKLEESFMISLNDSQKQLFIVTHFNPYFQFTRKSSTTDSLMRELGRLQHRMQQFVKVESGKECMSEEPSESNQNAELTSNFKFYFLFLNALLPGEVAVLFDGEKYDLGRLVSAILKTGRWSKKLNLIISNYYFKEELLSIRQVADSSDCSEQLVRMSITKLTSEILPQIIETILSEVTFEELDFNYSEDKNWFIADPFKKFDFNGTLLTPNYRLGHDTLKVFYKDKFFPVDDLLSRALSKNRTFGFDTSYLFLSKKFVEKVSLTELLVFLEQEIYEFESVRFDYNLMVLIDRFYKENSIPIEKNDTEVIYKLISKIKLNEIKVSTSNLKRSEKKVLAAKVSDILETYLNDANQAKRTKELLSVLEANNVNLDRIQLLLILKSMPETFVRMGNGLCGLRKWSKEQNLQGSIREIVEHKLSSIDTPLHISEILSLLGDFRDVSKQSIVTNLKVTESGIFKFFNCAYIGLKTKKYDDYWNKIPRFVPAKFMSVYRNDELNEEMKIKKLVEFGYPEIHVRSVIKSKKQGT